ncbi:MAG: hypothetical protein AB7S68_39405, partial [Polyangiaceae bacterium]
PSGWGPTMNAASPTGSKRTSVGNVALGLSGLAAAFGDGFSSDAEAGVALAAAGEEVAGGDAAAAPSAGVSDGLGASALGVPPPHACRGKHSAHTPAANKLRRWETEVGWSFGVMANFSRVSTSLVYS